MQSSHRKRHRIIWIFLTIVVAVALWVALASGNLNAVKNFLNSTAVSSKS